MKGGGGSRVDGNASLIGGGRVKGEYLLEGKKGELGVGMNRVIERGGG